MRTRTLLTTPPSRSPVEDTPTHEERPERYSRGLALPHEPRIPSRTRPLQIAVAVIVALVLIAWLVLRVLLAGQFQDPSLTGTPVGDEATFDEGEQDPTLQIPDDAASEPTG